MIWFVGAGALLFGMIVGIIIGLRIADNAVMNSFRW